MLGKTFLSFLPILAQLEVPSRVRRRQQLEHRQSHATRVDLLEDLADRFLRSRLRQIDRRHVVLHEWVDERFLKLHPFVQSFLILPGTGQQVRHLPSRRLALVENDV